MSYLINTTDLETLGMLPMRDGNESALTGYLDFPARYGTTEKDWGTETEAFVTGDDLEWKEREFTFKLLAKAVSSTALLSNLNSLETLLKSGLISFETTYDSYQLLLNSEMAVKRIKTNLCSLELGLIEPDPQFVSLIKTASGGSGYLIDNFNLRMDFGILVSAIDGNKGLPARIEVQTTDTYTQTAYRKPKDINLTCAMIQPDMATLISEMKQFHALLASPGLKTFKDRDASEYQVYVKDGFQVKVLQAQKVAATFTLKLRAV